MALADGAYALQAPSHAALGQKVAAFGFPRALIDANSAGRLYDIHPQQE
jgi:hypothetical protein